MAQKYTDEEMADALHKTKGIVEHASRAIGCSLETIRLRVKKTPELSAIVQQYKDSGIYKKAVSKTKVIPAQRYYFTDEEIFDALEKANGKVSKTAKILDCTVQSIYAYMRTRPQIKAKQLEIIEKLNDVAEENLFELVEKNDLNAIKYWLDANAKHRGYGSKDININQVGVNFTANVDLSKLTISELEALNDILGNASTNDSIIDGEFTNEITD